MLLRTSSAPVLSSLGNQNLPQVEACKDSLEPPHYVHSSNLSSFHGLTSPPTRSSSDRHGICGGDDSHTGLTSELEMDRILRPPRLSRAQSEGDLACFTAAMGAIACDNGYDSASSSIHAEWNKRISRSLAHSAISPFDMKESILEEVDEPEQPLLQASSTQGSLCNGYNASLDLNHGLGIVLNDGELYSSFKHSPSGSALACNSKGCRPLTESEFKKLGFLDIASGVGDNICGWTGYNDTLRSDSTDSRDAYYQSLLQTDPGNPLLLRNFAEYLSKKGDFVKSEEYFGRAILADPSDGEALSQYAKLQWDVNRDQERAETYYGQAVQAAPDDCYVMASYASFLWDVEENEETSPAAPAVPAYGATSLASSPLVASA